MRLLAAAVLYFAIVSAVGFVLGPIRVFWLEPVVKTFIAANFGGRAAIETRQAA